MIEDANLAGAELFGVARSQLSGRALTSFLAPISASSLTSGLGTVASGDGA